MKNQTITLLAALALLLFAGSISANNITVSNTKLTGQNTTDGYTLVQFDLSWENSWRTSSAPNNWDAAWVFVKYRITAANGGDNLWNMPLSIPPATAEVQERERLLLLHQTVQEPLFTARPMATVPSPLPAHSSAGTMAPTTSPIMPPLILKFLLINF